MVVGCAPRDLDGDGEATFGLDPLHTDSDHDGLDAAEELALGGDPHDADTDDDGLDDLAESELGTALDDPDTDDDGYTDRDEGYEGKNPLDPNSVIYQGGWPYYFEKTELTGGVQFEVGNRFANLHLEDQFNDVVCLWDFYNDDTYIIVELCETWHSDCQWFSKWMNGKSNSFLDQWTPVIDAVRAGELNWITILTAGDTGPADHWDLVAWTEQFPVPYAPVLADPTYESYAFVTPTVLPTFVLLAPDLKVHATMDPWVGYGSVFDPTLEILDP